MKVKLENRGARSVRSRARHWELSDSSEVRQKQGTSFWIGKIISVEVCWLVADLRLVCFSVNLTVNYSWITTVYDYDVCEMLVWNNVGENYELWWLSHWIQTHSHTHSLTLRLEAAAQLWKLVTWSLATCQLNSTSSWSQAGGSFLTNKRKENGPVCFCSWLV